MLRRSDFKIFTACDSAEACAVIGTETVDLVILDIQLADVSGEQFCRQISSREGVPKLIILLVCNDTDDDFARLKDSGAAALIARPIKPLQLIKTVGQFLTVQLVRSRRVSLRVKVISKKDAIEFFCLSHNISLTGMLIETDFSLELGCTIICQFSIPGSIDVESEGEIVRSSRTMDGAHQYGIRFTAMHRRCRHEIDTYIASIVRGETPYPI